jgi:hypothetical protein
MDRTEFVVKIQFHANVETCCGLCASSVRLPSTPILLEWQPILCYKELTISEKKNLIVFFIDGSGTKKSVGHCRSAVGPTCRASFATLRTGRVTRQTLSVKAVAAYHPSRHYQLMYLAADNLEDDRKGKEEKLRPGSRLIGRADGRRRRP